MAPNDDAVDEQDLILCCALCCANISVYPTVDCFGCSGTAGLCCINLQCCCQRGAPCLVPFGCLGLEFDGYEDGCNFVNAQCHCCCWVTSIGVPPCNDDVPAAVSVVGLTVYPKLGCCIKQGEIMDRD